MSSNPFQIAEDITPEKGQEGGRKMTKIVENCQMNTPESKNM